MCISIKKKLRTKRWEKKRTMNSSLLVEHFFPHHKSVCTLFFSPQSFPSRDHICFWLQAGDKRRYQYIIFYNDLEQFNLSKVASSYRSLLCQPWTFIISISYFQLFDFFLLFFCAKSKLNHLFYYCDLFYFFSHFRYLFPPFPLFSPAPILKES